MLTFAEELSSRTGPPASEPGRDTRVALLECAGAIPKEDLERMSEAVKEGYKRADE